MAGRARGVGPPSQEDAVDVMALVAAVEEGGLSFILFTGMVVVVFITFLITMAR